MKKKGDHLPGIILTAIFTIVSLAFVYFLFNTKMIPQMYIAAAGAVLLIFILLAGCLVWKFQYKVRFSLGTLLITVICAILLLGSSYIQRTISTLDRISGVTTETAQIGIYVKKDDPAEKPADTAGYKVGILKDLDRENTDETIAQLEKELNTEIETQEYAGLSELTDGLLNGETDSAILNQAYLGVIEEMGHPDIHSEIREIDRRIIQSEIKTETDETIEIADGDADQTADAEKSEKKSSFWKTNSTDKVYTIFVSGIDNRGGLIAKSRSDVNIIATINTATKQILLVSTPRDYFVPLSISKGVPDKLTHAGIYGINVCMDTLGMLYDTEINYYFRINFDGFINIIDALGGITVHSDYEFGSQNETGYHFVQGPNDVDGKTALAFARERYAFKEGDRQRGKNQMAVIEGVINKALSPDLLKNYSSILKAVEGSFETNVTYEEIAAQLQNQLKNGGEWNIISYSTDGTGATKKPYSMSQAAYVMEPDYTTVEKAKELMQQVRDGEIIDKATVNAPAENAETGDSTVSETDTSDTAAQGE